jgi:hypothetical protein
MFLAGIESASNHCQLSGQDEQPCGEPGAQWPRAGGGGQPLCRFASRHPLVVLQS